MKLVGIYYSHEPPPLNIGAYCRRAILETCRVAKIPCIAVTGYQVDGFDNWCHMPPLQRGHYDISARTRIGCELAISMEATHVLLFEHDVVYPARYAHDARRIMKRRVSRECQPAYLYNSNVYRINQDGYGRVNSPETLTSQLMAPAYTLRDTMTSRLAFIAKGGKMKWGEPGRDWEGCPDEPLPIQYWRSDRPAVDVRLAGNLTGSRQFSAFNRIEGLPPADELRGYLLNAR